VARLTGDETLLDLALWLAQSDNLHLIQWFGRSGPEAEVSAYFTPREWWDLGANGIIVEQQRVYENVLRAMEPHLPGRWVEPPVRRPARLRPATTNGYDGLASPAGLAALRQEPPDIEARY